MRPDHLTSLQFDEYGVLPPVWPGEALHSSQRSPYHTDSLTFCQRFGGTPHRRQLLSKLLEFRQGLRLAGLSLGIQWINGSFVEDVEKRRERPPKDIDVVTLTPLGDKAAQDALICAHPNLFDNGLIQDTYGIDHYFVPTDKEDDRLKSLFTRKIAYWYSMWSHQRETLRWKGYVAVPLQSSDQEARSWLESMERTSEVHS